MTPIMMVLISILLILLGLVVGYFVRKTIAEAKIAAHAVQPSKFLKMRSVMLKH